MSNFVDTKSFNKSCWHTTRAPEVDLRAGSRNIFLVKTQGIFSIKPFHHKGQLKNYADKMRWVGGQVMSFFLSTFMVKNVQIEVGRRSKKDKIVFMQHSQ